jgi:glutathione transport system permease protein
MLNYILKRLLGLLPTLLIVAVLVFLFVHMLPGDPARLAAGVEADAQTVLVRKDLGLDKPLPSSSGASSGTCCRATSAFAAHASGRCPPRSPSASADLLLTLTSMVWAVLLRHGDRHRSPRCSATAGPTGSA